MPTFSTGAPPQPFRIWPVQPTRTAAHIWLRSAPNLWPVRRKMVLHADEKVCNAGVEQAAVLSVL